MKLNFPVSRPVIRPVPGKTMPRLSRPGIVPCANCRKTIPRISPNRQNLGLFEELLTSVVGGLFGGGSGGTGGAVAPMVPSNQNVNTVTVSPNIQTQISPNISPVFQQSWGSAPQSASTQQYQPTSMVAPTPTAPVASLPVETYPQYSTPVENFDTFQTVTSPDGYTTQTSISASAKTDLQKAMPWIIGILGVVVVVKVLKK